MLIVRTGLPAFIFSLAPKYCNEQEDNVIHSSMNTASETSKNGIDVLLADDHTLVREGLRSLLDSEFGINVVGEAKTGREALQMALQLQPDIVLMDVAMPLLNGVEATRQLQDAAPHIKVLVLSAHSDDAYVERVLSSGARGYLAKQSSFQILAEAIRTVHQGKLYLSRNIEGKFLNQTKKYPAPGFAYLKKRPALSSRELEVLQLIAEGKANKQIASILEISIKTVEKHRQNLMNKLDIHDTAGLTRYAIGAGVIESCMQQTTI
jgi:DNA-binding NarL/FixJ family response regulator